MNNIIIINFILILKRLQMASNITHQILHIKYYTSNITHQILHINSIYNIFSTISI